MREIPPFTGFPPAGFDWFRRITVNNNKTWFEAHKAEFVENLQRPSQAFVLAFGERLASILPTIGYDPRPHGGSLMRIYRDVRFSKDKSPYKNHIGANFWDGEKGTPGSGFHFFMDAEGARLYAGDYEFSKPALERYRKAVDSRHQGEQLQAIVDELERSEGFGIGGEQYKRVPAGFDPDHPRAALLRHKGLYGHSPQIDPDLLHRPELVDRCLAYAETLLPLHAWFKGMFQG